MYVNTDSKMLSFMRSGNTLKCIIKFLSIHLKNGSKQQQQQSMMVFPHTHWTVTEYTISNALAESDSRTNTMKNGFDSVVCVCVECCNCACIYTHMYELKPMHHNNSIWVDKTAHRMRNITKRFVTQSQSSCMQKTDFSRLLKLFQWNIKMHFKVTVLVGWL